MESWVRNSSINLVGKSKFFCWKHDTMSGLAHYEPWMVNVCDGKNAEMNHY